MKKKTIVLFSVIAILIGFELLLFFFMVSKIEHDGETINISGQQRMLSQKISKLCLQIENETYSNLIDSDLKEELTNIIELFVASHEKLQKGHKSDETEELFAKLQDNYDKLVSSAKKIANSQDDENALIIIVKNEGLFLFTMDRIVFQYEIENGKKTNNMIIVMIIIASIILLFLVLALKLIVLPTINKEKQNLNIIKKKSLQITKQNDELTASAEELRQNNEELLTLNEQLNEANYLIQEKNGKIEKAHKDITASINYAKRIQEALLTSKKLIESYFNEYFIFFKPKETVSGDFYYMYKINKYIIFAVADCTGHGVPGGFLTMLGITYLHEIVRQKEKTNSGFVLNQLRQRIKNTFKNFEQAANNGLDIAFCTINTETNVLQYAGAYNPLWIIRENKLIEHKATRNPIGSYPKEVDFKNNEIQLFNNDVIYLFSDGYQDQYDSENKQRFTKKRFKALLLEIHKYPVEQQKELLGDVLKKWKKKNPQIDDIAILGVKWKI